MNVHIYICTYIYKYMYKKECNVDAYPQMYDEEWDECSCFEGYSGEECSICAEGFAGYPHCRAVPKEGNYYTILYFTYYTVVYDIK